MLSSINFQTPRAQMFSNKLFDTAHADLGSSRAIGNMN